jgi:hypothetical protein
MIVSWYHEGNTEEENMRYVVFKLNIHGSQLGNSVVARNFLKIEEGKNRV